MDRENGGEVGDGSHRKRRGWGTGGQYGSFWKGRGLEVGCNWKWAWVGVGVGSYWKRMWVVV